MRALVIATVAALVLIAGCGGSGGPESTDATTTTGTDGDSQSQLEAVIAKCKESDDRRACYEANGLVRIQHGVYVPDYVLAAMRKCGAPESGSGKKAERYFECLRDEGVDPSMTQTVP